MPLRGPSDVQFHIHAEALSSMRYLHHPRDAAVVFRVGAPEVSRLCHSHVRMPLDHMHMLALKQRRLQRLPQPLVSLKRHTAVIHWVFIPEEFVVVAGKSDTQRIPIGVIDAARIGHHRHLAAHALADCIYRGNFTLDRRCCPRVNLEALVSNFKALLGEIRIGFRRTQPVRRAVCVVCACVAGHLLTISAQQLVNRRIEKLAREVP